MRELHVRLVGHDSPGGTVRAQDLFAIGEAIRALVARVVVEVGGPRRGASRQASGPLAQVSIGIAPRGNRIIFRLGDSAALLDDPLAERVDQSLHEILDAMTHNRCPEGTAPGIAHAVDDLVRALFRAARRVELGLEGHPTLAVTTRRFSRRPWREAAGLVLPELVEAPTPARPFVPIGPAVNPWPELREPVQDELPV